MGWIITFMPFGTNFFDMAELDAAAAGQVHENSYVERIKCAGNKVRLPFEYPR
jgi:hypothetical protein